ncbi:hypothetical protein I5J50_gp82 [Mycobacterium phage Purky]|uniref:Uncharacterized protein n=1 Tax=Mycobacterium phage Purky TaxID=2593351 RepID=A0A514TWX7_9CAUD|nr:hypothetical protein I5J50_gp82 [Mycobacterium phage Purky]QDK01185.1 hypothetical protein SEA_PURKY_82 [Mycobacterium phage Purky]
MAQPDPTRKTIRQRLSDAWWDIRHPISTIGREVALRYCRRRNLAMVPRAVHDHVHCCLATRGDA